MEINRKENGNSIVFHIKGNLIGAAIVQLCKMVERARESDHERVLLDLSGVEQIDSRAIGGLIYSGTLLRKQNKRLALTAVSESVMQLLDGCSLQGVLDVESVPTLIDDERNY
jgi:anti-anti-sigma factor